MNASNPECFKNATFEQIGFLYDQAFQHSTDATRVEHLVQVTVEQACNVYHQEMNGNDLQEWLLCLLNENCGRCGKCKHDR